jgi:DNA-binding SARP family transcriptional activator
MVAEFHLLGAIEARIDGRAVAVGHMRQWCVLVALLMDANRAVPPDQLVDRVWGDHTPQRARDTLYSYISRLRRAFGTTGEVAIRRQPAGYVLEVDPETVDVQRFQRLTAAARAAADGDAALALLDQAVALWRGEAFAALDTPWLNEVRAGLDRARLAAELDRNDLALNRGQHAELLTGMSAAAAAHPFDERLAGQLMLALYRSGRQGDALACYRRIRRQLAEELGTDPAPPLHELHQRILAADPALAAPVAAEVAHPAAVPRQLPTPPRGFTGRTDELAALTAAMDAPSAPSICAIVGPGGIGKTWLALRWAHDNRLRYPDGQLYVDLRGFDPARPPVPPAQAIRAFLDALAVPPEAIPVDPDAQVGLYRSLVADRRLLVVLDNARDSAQVVPLLPGTGSVLVTSRHQLTGLVTAHGARPLTLDLLTDVAAHQVLTSHLGTARVAAEPDSVAALLRLCAGLPLALGIVAARGAVHPGLPLGALAEELDGTATRLDALDAGELPVNLRAALACSVDALPDPAARLFGLLGVVPGPDLSVAAAASLAGLPVTGARILLRQLAAVHLVQEHVPGRYRLHDLVRLYAAERAGTADRCAALHRVLDHYLHSAYRADRLLSPHRDPVTPATPGDGVTVEDVPDHRHALAWFTAERAVLVAAVHQAAASGFETHAWQLAWALATFQDRRAHWDDRATTHAVALDAAGRLTDRSAQAYAHRGLALADVWLGRYDEARTRLLHVLELLSELGDVTGQADSHRSMARTYARQGRPRHALAHDQRALDLYRVAGHEPGQATALNAVGWHLTHLGDHQLALAHCARALALHQRLGNRHGAALTWDSLGYAHRQLGQYTQATACYQHAAELFGQLGDGYQEAVTLTNLGDTHHAAGQPDLAHGAWEQADRIFDELNCPDARQHARLRPVARAA